MNDDIEFDETLVAGVEVIGHHILRVTFIDGKCGDVDLRDKLRGPVFEPLEDPAFFAHGKFDEEAGTVVWPNGADLAPEFLREQSRVEEKKLRTKA
jgi:hypothetical protein